MSGSPETVEAFIVWALKAGQRWGQKPAQRLPMPAGYQLQLFGGLFRYGMAWSNSIRGVGLTGENARRPLTVYKLQDLKLDLNEPDQEFRHAGTFVLELLVAQDWLLPDWGRWVSAVWSLRGHLETTNSIRHRLYAEVVDPLQREIPGRLLRERVLAAALEDADLASLLAYLTPSTVLEDEATLLALLVNPESAAASLWRAVPKVERPLLPLLLSQWVQDTGLTYSQLLERVGLQGQLHAELACMHPHYLLELRALLLNFSQVGLVNALWEVASDSILRDCIQQGEYPYAPLLRPTVSTSQLCQAWELWAQREPGVAIAFARQFPRPPV